jgi:hypothetical protein
MALMALRKRSVMAVSCLRIIEKPHTILSRRDASAVAVV